MSASVGVAAGKLWAFLEKNGACTPSKISKESDLSLSDMHRAIGWLAREGKIEISVNGRIETIALKQ